MEKFREIYNSELERIECGFEKEVFSLTETRAFVYEVCKRVVLEHDNPHTFDPAIY